MYLLFHLRLNCLAFDLINGGFVLPPASYLALIFSFIIVTDDWKIIMKFCKETVNIFDHFADFWWHFRNIQPTREEVETYALKFLAWKHMPAFFLPKEWNLWHSLPILQLHRPRTSSFTKFTDQLLKPSFYNPCQLLNSRQDLTLWFT